MTPEALRILALTGTFVVVGLAAAALRLADTEVAELEPGPPGLVELEPGFPPGMAPRIERLVVHPTRSDWLLALGTHRVSYVTRDRGRSWAPVLLQDPFPGRELRVPEPSPMWHESGMLVAVRAGAVYLSSDVGLTFDRYLVGAGVVGLEEGRDGGIRLVLNEAAGGGHVGLIVHPRPEGEGPVPELVNDPGPGSTAPAPRFLPTDAGSWALEADGPSFRPRGTTTWEPRRQGLGHPVPVRLTQHPDRPSAVALIDTEGRLWSSADFGVTWAQQPVSEVLEAVFLDGPGSPGWLVRHRDLQLARVHAGTVEPLGPPLREIVRLVVPPYVDRPHTQPLQRQLLLALARDPQLEAAGVSPEGDLWVQWAGIDSLRDRWVRHADGSWESQERPERTRHLVAWGESASRSCRVSLQNGVAFVGDQPVPDAPDTVMGDALEVGFASENELYVIAERGVQLRQLGPRCAIGESVEAWQWEAPPMRTVRALTPLDVPTEDRASGATEGVRLLGTGEHGLWRLDLPLGGQTGS